MTSRRFCAQAGFAVVGANRAFLAVADRLHTVLIDAESDQIVLGRVGTTLAEGEVVLARAAVVAMAFDHETILRIGLQPGSDLLQLALRFGRQIVTVEAEEDPVADAGGELFDGAGGRTLGNRCRRGGSRRAASYSQRRCLPACWSRRPAEALPRPPLQLSIASSNLSNQDPWEGSHSLVWAIVATIRPVEVHPTGG